MELKEYKCLIVDDHMLSRQLVTSILKERGLAAIDCAGDGVSGLQKIKEALAANTPYHIVFLDWSMPNMSGYDVLVACRRDRQLDSMAIVMLSAESEDINVVKAMEAGATAYVTKPFKVEALVKKLNDVVAWRAGKTSTS